MFHTKFKKTTNLTFTVVLGEHVPRMIMMAKTFIYVTRNLWLNLEQESFNVLWSSQIWREKLPELKKWPQHTSEGVVTSHWLTDMRWSIDPRWHPMSPSINQLSQKQAVTMSRTLLPNRLSWGESCYRLFSCVCFVGFITMTTLCPVVCLSRSEETSLKKESRSVGWRQTEVWGEGLSWPSGLFALKRWRRAAATVDSQPPVQVSRGAADRWLLEMRTSCLITHSFIVAHDKNFKSKVRGHNSADVFNAVILGAMMRLIRNMDSEISSSVSLIIECWIEELLSVALMVSADHFLAVVDPTSYLGGGG